MYEAFISQQKENIAALSDVLRGRVVDRESLSTP